MKTEKRCRCAGALPLLLVVLAAACGRTPPPPIPAPQQIEVPDPAEIERVIFLVGDAGTARAEYYPIIPRLEQDVEWWAEHLDADSAVTVLFLGDIVYPLGLHAPGTSEYPGDSAIVMAQVGLLDGPVARQRGARGYFIAGNHDWGLEQEWEGFVRLRNLDTFLQAAREHTGADVQLMPPAGKGGPVVLDLGEHVRLLLLDTAWWLLDGGRFSGANRTLVLQRIEQAMQTAGDREVMLAAHHPFRSAGPHGGAAPWWETFGARYLLARSGAILQDITSVPYRELANGLRTIFARQGPALASIGGHEHSLQVIEAVAPDEPRFSIVSGSASKMSEIGGQEGLVFAHSAPGYMRLLVHKDGRMSVFAEASPREFQTCPREEPARSECMAEGVASFEIIHSQYIR